MNQASGNPDRPGSQDPGTEQDQPEVMAAQTEDGRSMLVGDDTLAVEDSDGTDSVASMVEEPAKVMRIGTMIRQLLEEVKSAPLDDASRQRLSKIYASSVAELKAGLNAELADELERIAQPLSESTTDAEIRIAQAQLVGWLEGLFRGIQTALVAQQMAAQSQLAQMNQAALPPGDPGRRPGHPPAPGPHPLGSNSPGGMYL